MLRLPTLALAFALGLSGASAASATTFSFHCISGDGGGACAIPIEELSLEVTDLGGGEISFTFHNDNGDPSSIVSIYFDDDLDLLACPEIDDGNGVDYAKGGSPGNLPSGNVEDFHADRVFSAANPQKANGVGPGESVTIRFTASFPDVVEALESGELRVGLHAPGFGNHGNKSFVNDVQGVPEPGLLALLALGAGALALRR